MGPPYGRFGSDVAGHQAVRGAGETAIGQQSDGIAEACADERRGHREHFAHARAAARTFVTNHHHIAGLDLSLVDCGKRGFFAIENARGAAEVLRVVPGNFDDAAFRRKIAFEE